MKVWKSHGSKLLYKDPFMEIHEYQAELPNKKIIPYFVAKRPPSCIIIPVDGDYTYLIEQYRIAARKTSFELPGGGVNVKDPKIAAAKELKEETGISARKIEYIGSFFINTGYSNQICYVYTALGLTYGKTSHEANEFLKVRKVTFKKFEAMIKKGKVIDSASISAYYLYLASKGQYPS